MTAACAWLAAAVLLAAACTGAHPGAAAREPGSSMRADRVADRVGSEPAPAAPAREDAAAQPMLAHPLRPAALTHRSSFEVGASGVSIAGTYRDCTGRSPVGWGGAYYEPCMGIPYWIGHHAILGAILDADRVTYWDDASLPHRWHVIGRRVLRAGSTYPGPLPGAVAELQTCLQATDTSPVEIVDYS
jgi:hypothetical protein